MKGLNLSGFEKVKEDKDAIHMKHKDGHVIVIAVKALPKIQKEQLKRLKMADGGDVWALTSDTQESMRRAFGTPKDNRMAKGRMLRQKF